MDWYIILQIQKWDADDVTIKKQYEKLALLLHPDKNKFAGAEAAFKLIREAISVMADQSKRSTYDMKRRAQVKTGSSPSAHPTNGNLFVRKQNNTPQSQFPPHILDTLSFLRAFVAQDLGIQSQGAHPESAGNINFQTKKNLKVRVLQMQPHKAMVALENHPPHDFTTERQPQIRHKKVGVAADVKMSKSGPVKSPVKSKG
ncbi:hypothetical protein TB2_010251 [Malus domestica]